MKKDTTILVVLGYPANDDGSPGSILKARLDKAIELFSKGRASKIILTGAAVYNHHVESDVMAEYCIEQGIPQEHIVKECHARNTFENARMVRDIMKDNGYNNAIVVTSSFHKMRAKRFFARIVGNVTIVAAPFPQGFSPVKRAVFIGKEYLIIMLYNMGLLNNRYAIQQS